MSLRTPDDTILHVASSLTPKNQSSQELTKLQTAVADLLAEGYSAAAIARKLAKGDEHKARMVRKKIRYWFYNVPAFQQAVAQGAKAELGLGVGQTAQAVLKRASRGRIDAAKLVFEASGFHNPRVQHEHSGDIKISLEMPRPAARTELEEPVVDAEVVDE